MSEQQHSGFGQFIPGFDFLQNLAKGASPALPQMPSLSSWVAPTLNVEELEKRIGELKAVQFWLEQNRTALAATIQALEVQKMTLATLQGMNFNMAEMADAFKLKPGAAPAAAPPAASEAASAPAPKASKSDKGRPAKVAGQHPVVDPLQWWGALTQQFQQIASTAMQDAAASAEGLQAAASGASGKARPAGGRARKPAAGAKRAARKTTAR